MITREVKKKMAFLGIKGELWANRISFSCTSIIMCIMNAWTWTKNLQWCWNQLPRWMLRWQRWGKDLPVRWMPRWGCCLIRTSWSDLDGVAWHAHTISKCQDTRVIKSVLHVGVLSPSWDYNDDPTCGMIVNGQPLTRCSSFFMRRWVASGSGMYFSHMRVHPWGPQTTCFSTSLWGTLLQDQEGPHPRIGITTSSISRPRFWQS